MITAARLSRLATTAILFALTASACGGDPARKAAIPPNPSLSSGTIVTAPPLTARPVTRIILETRRTGPATVTLPKLTRPFVTLQVRWQCQGTGEFHFVVDAKTLLGGGCGTAPDALVRGGVIPYKLLPNDHLTIETDPHTSWHLVIAK